ncbi:hypothetical protein EAL2_c20670 [Peptoclostridium acidaminophilum DSM 3953]|uniref:Uncharacterized protein n=1 Tax=Peptoclostridium acidaminophilum DSM 3953 TaxID=1286171 RepID=W8THN3_PEPAC|nr:Na+/H+ antiporter subunit E [Peptoclostridium acidaminophilum]AHM57348.1 hypothetical protein EAL2_c20670 [Peptoclostridium acidaminophilum DSM 3953]
MSWRTIRLSLALFIFYMLLTIDFSALNIGAGLMLSIAVSYFSARVLYDPAGDSIEEVRIPGPLRLVSYLLFLLLSIYRASFRYMLHIIRNDEEPAALRIRLHTSNPFVVSLIANSITLTPGTITLSSKGDELTVLCIKGDRDYESLRSDIIEGFERQLTRRMRK